MRSWFLMKICALTASLEYIAGCAQNPVLQCAQSPREKSFERVATPQERIVSNRGKRLDVNTDSTREVTLVTWSGASFTTLGATLDEATKVV